MAEQRGPGGPAEIHYEQQYQALADEHRATGDPTVFVFENYLRWKGVPLNGARPAEVPEHLSRHFSVLEYPGSEDFRVFCTLGASLLPLPGSPASFGDERGVRYEYIMHAAPRHDAEASELLMLVAEYPYQHRVEVQPGFALHVGEPVAEGSGMEYLYFTYPYVDDARLYEQQPWGQIERGKALIQTLWVFPIYRSEYAFLRQRGPEAFEDLANERHRQRYDAYDFARLPYV